MGAASDPGQLPHPASLAELIERNDLDGLVAHVDSACFDREWRHVVELRDRCRAALERGKQLWPAAAYAEYRLALDAPGELAASVLGSSADRFTHGPFAEVMASTHTFEDLSGHLPVSPASSTVAHERVCRGEDLRADQFAISLPDVFGLPLATEPWEPTYPAAEYSPTRVLASPPEMPRLDAAVAHSSDYRVVVDATAVEALRDLAHTWVASSNGRAEAIAVEGDAVSAVSALGAARVRLARVGGCDALAWMCWAAASAGANGRRRGTAAGRHATWWALAAVAGLGEPGDDPATPDELGEAVSDLRWYLWDDGTPATGWSLRLAIEDPTDGLAWALAASDARLA